jgi:hypothetical protein
MMGLGKAKEYDWLQEASVIPERLGVLNALSLLSQKHYILPPIK